MSSSQSIHFNRNESKAFHTELRKRVDQYFKDKNVDVHATMTMHFKTVLIAVSFFASWGLIISGILPLWLFYIVAAFNGFTSALIGLNIAHDAIHGAYSKNHTVNKALGHFMCLIGANDYMWSIKHNKVHHTFTNIPGVDDDLNQPSILRIAPDQPLKFYHRYQTFYMFLLYPLASFSWIFVRDFKNLSRVTTDFREKNPPSTTEYIRFFGFKALYFSVFLILPFFVLPYAWYHILAGFMTARLVEGFVLAMIFQLAHLVEDVEFPEPDATGNMEHNWAIHQLYTTANFACKNPMVNFLYGGLNFQIEHHLFPNICHIHYSNLSYIVRDTAKEFQLPYNEYGTMTSAVGAHIRMMDRFSRGDEFKPSTKMATI
jgi:linoleoyl-CoA desaturase